MPVQDIHFEIWYCPAEEEKPLKRFEDPANIRDLEKNYFTDISKACRKADELTDYYKSRYKFDVVQITVVQKSRKTRHG